MNKSRQQRANVKARKAKAKAKHQADFCSWKNRSKPRHCPKRPAVNPLDRPVPSLASLEAMIDLMGLRS